MIYLVDFIGVHCGMHYYLDAFKEILESVDGVKVGIVSNYSLTEDDPVLLNQYKGNKLQKMFRALRNLLRLKKFISKHKNDKFIYLTYGNILDPFFLKIVSQAPYHCVDVHEALAQNEQSNAKLKKKLARIYSRDIRNVISHSSRTNDCLTELGFQGKRFEVPHFKYVFPRSYDTSNISKDVLKAIDPDRVNFLFFGNITYEKGIDMFLEAINALSDEDAAKVNVIVAGKDIDGVYRNVKIKPDRKVSFFIRHISDDELRFLYQNTDFLVLPYRSTFQSGILEMAFYFKKPIIASDIPYFRKMLTEFPSFGYIAGNSSTEFASNLHEVLKLDHSNLFNEEDYSRYENRKEINEFKENFKDWMLSDKESNIGD